MSQTYSIACSDCKKSLWIAQGSYSDKKKGYLYSTATHLDALFAFLMVHAGHSLLFGVDVEEPIIDYDEVNGDKE